ncbi:MAG TPA: HAMP domain-containing sensor histidine kinase [Micropruina sp.]|jgi:signal transduction histidine kinase|nr:HAMP domain-containing sensor histidine kinase [Micropruina sp.]
MIGFADFLLIVAISALAAGLVCGAAVLALRLSRAASLTVQLVVLVGATVLSVVAATLAIAFQMYISPHDLVVLIWVIGVAAVTSLPVAWILGRRLSRSSARLRRTAREIGGGAVVAAAPVEGRELSELAVELAETSRRLAQARDEVATLDRSRRELIAWISHDLRTPLSALRAMAESLEDGVATDPERYLRQMQAQVDTLDRMVDDLFELSKIQTGTLTLAREPVSLFDLVSDSVADLSPVAAARRVRLRESGTGDLTLWGDARELSRVIGNLLMNAIQHSPEGGEILIEAEARGDGHVMLSVRDEGGGIPEEDLGRVFHPGWRGASARTPVVGVGTASGAGLGLAIVQGIVEAHAGGVSVVNVPGGCRFDVVLPRGLAA